MHPLKMLSLVSVEERDFSLARRLTHCTPSLIFMVAIASWLEINRFK